MWVGLTCPVQSAPDLVAVPEFGVRLQRGFRISLYADADLANDIQAMTIDSAGRVVVSGPGYIKTLHNPEGIDRADGFTLFATPEAGGMGLLCDGPNLYFSGNGWLSRYEDLDGDGRADRPPENLLPLQAGEHGGHGIRKGPDGNLYLIAGNDTGFTAQHDPGMRTVEGGALLRLSPEGRDCRVVAQGFRNPYDFDFDIAGEAFTWDGDAEGDLFLPWYTPARLYHVALGGHHGWRLAGRQRSWARPAYYADTVPPMENMGRAAPTGLACYRHRQFPAHFRGGLFGLDWAFGGIFFFPLQLDGASYQTTPELFLEPLGAHGFAPTAICVDTNGSLYVSTGGRKTRGSVFRIDYVGPPLLDPVAVATLSPELNFVLQAPQPLDAWSRAIWIPAAQRLGSLPFLRVAGDETVAPIYRMRAIEILTEVFSGLTPMAADAASAARSPLVRARVAWSLGKHPGPNPSLVLFPLLTDESAFVRQAALAAIAEHLQAHESPELVRLLMGNFTHIDKRVRLAAARVASLLSIPHWEGLVGAAESADPGTQLTWLLARLWRETGGGNPDTLAPLAGILSAVKDPMLRLDTLRLIILALGDWNLPKPSMEVFTGCEAAVLPVNQDAALTKIRVATRALIPNTNPDVQAEAARLLAMLQDADPRVARVLANINTPKSPADVDFHNLVCFARLKTWPVDLIPKIADVLLGLDAKIEGLGTHPQQNWNLRVIELTQALKQREPRLAAAMLNHPRFATPEHLSLAAQIGPEHQTTVAKLYLAAVKRNTNFPWSPELIEILDSVPPEELKPLLRAQWRNVLLRDDILLHLAASPAVADRPLFWQGLNAWRLESAAASVGALLSLPREPARTNFLAPFGLLHRLLDEPKEKKLRADVLTLLSLQTGRNFEVKEPEVPPKPTLAHAAVLKTAYQPVFAWLATNHPAVFKALDLRTTDDPLHWRALLKSIPWAKGNPEQGEQIALDRGCVLCHLGPKPIAPDLGGIASRLNVEELFDAIVFPSRDIRESHRSTSFLLKDGSVVTGLVVHESSGAALVQTTATTTERLSDDEILSRQPSKQSFMPPGLLDDLKPGDLADLHAFLKTLSVRK